MNKPIFDVFGGPRQVVALALGMGLLVAVGAAVPRAAQHAGGAGGSQSVASGAEASVRRGVAGYAPAAAMSAGLQSGAGHEQGFAAVGCIGAQLETVRGAGLPDGEALAAGLRRGADGTVLGPALLWSPDEQVAACFDSSTAIDATVLAQIEARLRQGLPKFNIANRWSTTATNGSTGGMGNPITITWSFVPDGLPVSPDNPATPSLFASVTFARMDALFGGNRALWISKFQESFDRWGALTGVNYVRVSTGGNEWDDGAAWGNQGAVNARGDVRIGMRNIDGPSNVLAFNSFPNNGDMVIDSSENWGQTSNNFRFLRNVICHEHGHGLGLNHVCPTQLTKLMEPSLTTNFDGPQQDDVRAVQELYGDTSEPNNTAAQGVDIGLVSPSQVVTRGTVSGVNNVTLYSVFGNDVDWFRFQTNRTLLMRVTATPVGTSYATAGCSGTPAQVTTNALAMGDLRVDVTGSNGAPTIVSSNLAAAGAVEQATNLLLGPGFWAFRVNATNAPSDPQMYTVTVAANQVPSLAAATRVGGVQLSWTGVTNGTFTVYRALEDARASATLVETTAASTLLDTSAPANTSVYYWVEASQSGRAALAWAGSTLGLALRDCGGSDISGPGLSIGPDGELTADDVIVFINWFTQGDARADVASPGPMAGGDAEFTADDVILFVNRFSAGCP